jgi:hypothetical protein
VTVARPAAGGSEGTALEFQPASRAGPPAPAPASRPSAASSTSRRACRSTASSGRASSTRLGMRDVTFWPTDAQWPRVASVYGRSPTSLIKQTWPTTPCRARSTSRAGRLVQQRRGRRAVRPVAGRWRRVERHATSEPQVGGDAERGPLWPTHSPAVRRAGEGYGLSVRVVTNHAVRGTSCRMAPMGAPARRAPTSSWTRRSSWWESTWGRRRTMTYETRSRTLWRNPSPIRTRVLETVLTFY